MQKILAIDYGQKKIGTAVGDILTQIAFPKNNFSSKEDLFDFIEKNNFSIIILGNPKTNDDFFSDQQKLCEDFFEELQKKFSDKKIIFVDERYSSKIAQQKMKNFGLNQKKGKKYEDNLAAQILLEEFFEGKNLDF